VPRQCRPHSGRTTALSAATCCASLSSIAPVHQAYWLVADVPASLCGSEGWGFESLRARAQVTGPYPLRGGAFLVPCSSFSRLGQPGIDHARRRVANH
jgi:hypothetical protein